MNKFLVIIISILLFSPIKVLASDSPAVGSDSTRPAVNTIDDDIETITEDKVDYKVPIDKKKILNKFLVAMGAVAGSSLLIYIGLTAYNRVRENFLNITCERENNVSLATPDNYEDAVKTFLEKTNW